MKLSRRQTVCLCVCGRGCKIDKKRGKEKGTKGGDAIDWQHK